MEPIRASNAERDRVVSELAGAAAEGRLTLEELATRTEAALTATSRGELEPLTADLPAAVPRPGARRAGTRWVLGIMGGGDHSGRWRVAARCVVVNLMGGADLDLRQAEVDGSETEIVVVSIMGGSTITVPEGVVVDAGGFALMGGNDVRVEGPPPPPGAPVVRVRAWSLLGGTDVVTRPGPRGPRGLRPPPLPPPPRPGG